MLKVSVIVPSCRMEFLGEVFGSLAQQTVQPYEILYYFRSVGIPSLSQKVNDLVKISTGDAILVLCDDDMLDPTFLEKTIRMMESSECGIVYTDMQKFGSENFIQPASEYTEDNFKMSTVPFISSLIRKTVFEELGGWDPEQVYADWDFYYRAFKAGHDGYHLREPLFLYRIHPKSGSNNMSHELAKEKMRAKHPEIL